MLTVGALSPGSTHGSCCSTADIDNSVAALWRDSDVKHRCDFSSWWLWIMWGEIAPWKRLLITKVEKSLFRSCFCCSYDDEVYSDDSILIRGLEPPRPVASQETVKEEPKGNATETKARSFLASWAVNTQMSPVLTGAFALMRLILPPSSTQSTSPGDKMC